MSVYYRPFVELQEFETFIFDGNTYVKVPLTLDRYGSYINVYNKTYRFYDRIDNDVEVNQIFPQ